MLERKHRTANDPDEDRRVDDGDRDDHVPWVGPQGRDDAQREQDRREREEDVHRAADREIDQTAQVSREKPEDTAGRCRARDREHARGDPAQARLSQKDGRQSGR